MVWQLFCIVIVASYTANLAAYLTRSPSSGGGVTGIDDLASRNLPTCVLDGSSFWEQLKLDYPHLNPVFVSGSLETIIQTKLRTGVCAGVVYDYDFAIYVTNKVGFCDVHIAGGIFRKMLYGIGVKRSLAGPLSPLARVCHPVELSL